jgi:hypothetical protein
MPRHEGRAVSAATREEAIAASLAGAGLWGAILMAAIVATSALLRLATGIDSSGEAAGTLAPAVEAAMRLAHRIAAMGVGVLAAFAAMAALAKRPVPWPRLAAVAAIVALTVLLAAIGRHTAGYRSAAVSVGNVAGGTALACAFWWLRERERLRWDARHEPLAWIALAALLAQSGAGAAASTLAMRGDRSLVTPHVVLAVLFALLAAAAAWRGRASGRPAIVVAALVIVELALGVGSIARGDARWVALAWAHAMAGAALGPALVSLAMRCGASARGTLHREVSMG